MPNGTTTRRVDKVDKVHTADIPKAWRKLHRADELALLATEAQMFGALVSSVSAATADAARLVAALRGSPAVARAQAVQVIRSRGEALEADIAAAILASRSEARAASLRGLRRQLALAVGQYAETASRADLAQVAGIEAPGSQATPAQRDLDRASSAVVARSLAASWAASKLAVIVAPSAATLTPPQVSATIVVSGKRDEPRSATVATTETVDAFNATRADALRDLAPQFKRVHLPFLFRHWNATLDKRLCPRCESHEGEVVPIYKSFSGGDAPGLHPNCRCLIDILFFPMPSRAAA
jgi:hypothetical protein